MGEQLSAITMHIEAAFEEDGDITLWRRDLRLRLLGSELNVRGSFWREALRQGCGGELYQLDGAIVRGRMGACGLSPQPVFPATSLPSKRAKLRGRIGWVEGTAEFALVLDEADSSSMVVFAELDA